MTTLPTDWQDCTRLLPPDCLADVGASMQDAQLRCVLGGLARRWCMRYLPCLVRQVSGVLHDDGAGLGYYREPYSWRQLRAECQPDMEFDVTLVPTHRGRVRVCIVPDVLTGAMPELYCPVLQGDVRIPFDWISHDGDTVHLAQYALQVELPEISVQSPCQLHFYLGDAVNVCL